MKNIKRENNKSNTDEMVIAIPRRTWATDEHQDAVAARETLLHYLREKYEDVREIDDSRLEKPETLLAKSIKFIIVPSQRWFVESYFDGLVRFAELGGKVFATYPSFWKDEYGEIFIDKRLYGLFGVTSDALDREINGILKFKDSHERWLFKGLPSMFSVQRNTRRWGWVITSLKDENIGIGEWAISSARYWVAKGKPLEPDSSLHDERTGLCLVRKWASGGVFVYTCFDYETLLNENELAGQLIDNIAIYSYPSSVKNANPKTDPLELEKDVFIVHGHDTSAKESVARFVEHLGLNPIILNEKPNAGRTIIEKFEDHSNVGFAIVLLTPDDIGAPKDKTNETKPHARQNVILELGYFMGKLGRGRVCALYKEGVEIPSDYQGVLYIPMDSVGAWKTALAKEIKNAGIDVDLNKAI